MESPGQFSAEINSGLGGVAVGGALVAIGALL